MPELIEHPQFDVNLIPDGWERITTGGVLDRDRLLFVSSSGSKFIPCVRSDGTYIPTMSSGSCRIKDSEKLAPYKSVVIREITPKDELFLKTLKIKLPSFILITQNTDETIAKNTYSFTATLSTMWSHDDMELKPSARLISLIENISVAVFNVKPVFCHDKSEFFIKKSSTTTE
jgi:hypothetical protein